MGSQKAEIPRGNERILQLVEEFPEIPRNLVVKADLIREGLRPSETLHQLGRWALPYAPWFFEYGKEDTHTPEEASDGYIRTPINGYFSDGVSHQFMLDSRSPYEIRYEERGRYRLYRDGDPIEELFFIPRPLWYDRKTSSGKPLPAIIQQRREDLMMVVPLTYCEYGKDNRLCKYCNVNNAEVTKKALGMERITAKREQDVYEALVAAAPESHPRTSINMSGGVVLDSHKEAEVYARLLKALRRAMKDVGIEFPILVLCQALQEEDQRMLKEVGASSMVHNLEVWDPKLFEIICPGKAKYVGQQRWIEAVVRTKEIWGSSQCAFVCGVEMAQPHGFKTEDEAAESVLAGFEWMLAHGVVAGSCFWRPAPGTEFAGIPSPRTEYFLRLALAQHKLAVKYNMAPKPKRPPAIAVSLDFHLAYWGLRDAPAAGIARTAGPSQAVC